MADKHVQWQDATVVERGDIADGIVRLVLEPAMPVPARPGEHIDVLVQLPDGRDDERSYSIAGAGEGGRTLAVSVSRSATSRGGSEFMRSRKVGDALRITQPLQDFPLRVGAPSYVLVAGRRRDHGDPRHGVVARAPRAPTTCSTTWAPPGIAWRTWRSSRASTATAWCRTSPRSTAGWTWTR